KDEVTYVPAAQANMLPEEEGAKDEVILEDGTVKKATEDKDATSNVLPAGSSFFIAGESVYDQLPEPEDSINYAAWEVVEGSQEDIVAAGKELEEIDPGIMAIDTVVYDTNAIWGPVMFVGLFIGI